MTKKHKEILDFIDDFSETEGMAPTVYEIADYFEIKTSTVFAHLKALQKKQFISRTKKARSISLLKKQSNNKPKHLSFSLPIPLLGRINAGEPVDNAEYREGDVYCDPNLINNENYSKLFALKVQGQSMRDMGIFEDDIIIVKQTDSLRTGDIAVALVDNETTVKSYYPLNNAKIELRPANPDFQTQIYNKKKVSIQGRVIALQRKI